MLKRLVVLACLNMVLIALLTVQALSPGPIAMQPAARAQEPIPTSPDLGPVARDPAAVASELLLEPPASLPARVEQPPAPWVGQG